jgi:hypothetical protein
MLSRIVLAFLLLTLSGQSSGVTAQRPAVSPAGQEGTPVDPGPTPGSPSPPGVEPIVVTGSERLTWDFLADSLEDVQQLGFVSRVDDQSTDLHSIECQPSDEEWWFVCSAPMPPLEIGDHAIAVFASEPAEGGRQLGYPSTALLVRRVASNGTSTARADSTRVPVVSAREAPGPSAMAALAKLPDAPTAITALPDGRLLLAERSGALRLFARGALLDPPAARLDDVDPNAGRGILAIATDVKFDAHPLVYVLYTAVSGYRLARFTLAGDTLTDRMVLIDSVPISAKAASGALAMGPDERLYVAFGAGNADRALDMGSFAGKVLRLERDGTTPKDQKAGTPVFAAGFTNPIGLFWDTAGRALLVVQSDAPGIVRVSAITPTQPGRGSITASYTVQADVAGAAGAAHAEAGTSHRDLLLTTVTGDSIVRLHVNASGQVTGAERIPVAGVHAIAAAGEAIFAVTSQSLVRLRLAADSMK